jgi:hypothetical protein
MAQKGRITVPSRSIPTVDQSHTRHPPAAVLRASASASVQVRGLGNGLIRARAGGGGGGGGGARTPAAVAVAVAVGLGAVAGKLARGPLRGVPAVRGMCVVAGAVCRLIAAARAAAGVGTKKFCDNHK